MAAPAMVARISTFRRAWILSNVPLDIFVTNSIIFVRVPSIAYQGSIEPLTEETTDEFPSRPFSPAVGFSWCWYLEPLLRRGVFWFELGVQKWDSEYDIINCPSSRISNFVTEVYADCEKSAHHPIPHIHTSHFTTLHPRSIFIFSSSLNKADHHPSLGCWLPYLLFTPIDLN